MSKLYKENIYNNVDLTLCYQIEFDHAKVSLPVENAGGIALAKYGNHSFPVHQLSNIKPNCQMSEK